MTCTDGMQTSDESDVDCGGVCPIKCAVGKKCLAGADCASGNCRADRCAAPVAVDLVAGQLHFCARSSDGRVKCWGGNLDGQVGNGATSPATSPVAVDFGAGRTALSIAAGQGNTCAVLDDHTVRCWGDNSGGQLGNGTTGTDVLTPGPAIALGAGRTALSVTTGGLTTCAILDDRSLKCWGANGSGALGTGPGDTSTSAPGATVALGAGRTARHVATNMGSTCVALDDGSMKCWGSNVHGQLGNGTDGGGTMQTANTSLPGAPLDLGVGAKALAVAAGNTACALLDGGALKCWGDGPHGELGNGTSGLATRLNTPPASAIALGAGRTARRFATSQYNACAVLDDGTVKCWGWNEYGQVGNNQRFTDALTPAGPLAIGDGRTAVAVAATTSTTCVVLDDGGLKCWGWNALGQRGIGVEDNTSPATPPASSVSLGF